VSSPFKTIEPESPNSPEYRTPPGNFEAEMGLLGAMLINNRAYEQVSDYLRPEHFADPLHGRIFEACCVLIERGQRADPTTLKHFFDSDESFDEVGGAEYLAQLAADAVAVINVADYGKLIHDLYLRRELIELGSDVVNEAYGADFELSAGQQIESAEQKLYDLATTGDYEGGFISFTESMRAVVDTAQAAFQRGGYAGVPTGFTRLDLQLAGLHKSDLIILAARPSMGKTALATNIAFNIAASELDDNGNVVPRQDRSVGFFSLEMSSEQLANRILAEKAQIQSDQIRKGELNNRDFERLVGATQKLEKAPFFIDDTPALSVSALRTRARRLKRQHGLGLIVVDYLQLLQGSPNRRNENRVQEISEITRGLKTLAKELDVPVLALSQLSRAVEQREDKRPQLSDLRESGTIEQDADVVMFLFREEYYLERSEPGRRDDEDISKHNERHARWEENKLQAEGKAEVIISKQRHGPTGTIPLRFYPAITKFDNLEDEADGGQDSGGAPF
jgi:replicative DNA helicase